MASNTKSSNSESKNKKEIIAFSTDQLAEHLILMTQALFILFANQDVFNAMTKFFHTLSNKELMDILIKNLEKTNNFNKETDMPLIEAHIAELSTIVTIYETLSPILKVYQPTKKTEGTYHARGSSQTN